MTKDEAQLLKWGDRVLWKNANNQWQDGWVTKSANDLGWPEVRMCSRCGTAWTARVDPSMIRLP